MVLFLTLLMGLAMLLSLLFLATSHPISTGFTLMSQTVVFSLILGGMSLNYWFSFILFLIFIGGLLILMIYMTSLASNEKFKFQSFYYPFVGAMFLMVCAILPAHIFSWNNMLTPLWSPDHHMISWLTWKIMKIYFYTNANLTLFLGIYLLLTLIITVKLTQKFCGTLRSFSSYV